MDPQNPFHDVAAPILSAEPGITDEQRADLHDIFHGSKDPNELTQKLAPFAAPDDLKRRLFDAKHASMPVPAPLDKATAAITQLGNLDPKLLELAESHPQTLKLLVGAATTEPKSAQEPAGETSAAGKGTKAPAAKAPAAAPLAPRADGQPHFPPIPEGHHRILASDGGIHDIPAESIEKARAIDPNLHVLNP